MGQVRGEQVIYGDDGQLLTASFNDTVDAARMAYARNVRRTIS